MQTEGERYSKKENNTQENSHICFVIKYVCPPSVGAYVSQSIL